ncbi:MAG: peptidase M50 [Myxococcales bacterium]|nr:peptidase M50 [Myxococcales bacterium]
MPDDVFVKLVIVLGPLILAISVHEFAHIATARWLGDDLGTRLGRFTLDPLKHIDPLWTVILPGTLVVMSAMSGGSALPFFAAGKPAPYNPNGLTKRFGGQRIPLRTAEMLIAAAGPASNLLLAILSLILVAVLSKLEIGVSGEHPPVVLLLHFVTLNVALLVFNMIPVPPLDGSKVLYAFLPGEMAEKYEAVASSMSMIVLFVIIFMGAHFISIPVLWIVGVLQTIIL